MLKKFTFDTSFDEAPAELVIEAPAEEEPIPEEPIEPPAPTFSEEEMEMAKKLSFDEGMRAGQEEIMQSLHTRQTAALEKVSVEIQAIATLQQQLEEGLQHAALTVAHAYAEALFPVWVKAAETQEINGLLKEALKGLSVGAQVRFHCPEDEVGFWEEHTQALPILNAAQLSISVIGDPALQAGDCRLEWQDGGVERIQQEIWHKIQKLLPEGATMSATVTLEEPTTEKIITTEQIKSEET